LRPAPAIFNWYNRCDVFPSSIHSDSIDPVSGSGPFCLRIIRRADCYSDPGHPYADAGPAHAHHAAPGSDCQRRMDALASDVGGADALAAWQSAHGYTSDSFQSALKRAAEAAWMRDKIITAVPGTADQVHARQILLYNEDTARKVADQLDAGANFDDLAVLYDPNTGGELGWFPRGYLLEPDLEEAAFSLEPGQHSGVIASEVGYHILLVVERDAQHPLSPDAYLVMQEKALGDWLAQKRTESEIVLAP
jgi:peptidyl-prolyl cis-trans isomerase C